MEADVRPLVAVLDYGIGNLRSAQKALQRVGADARLTADAGLAADAAGVVLPGVGAFGRCAAALRDEQLDQVALATIDAQVPFLAICVGMQLLYEGSEENPGIEGLGVLAGTVRRLGEGVKRPQMQWNVVDVVGNPAFADSLPRPVWAYFVHSFAPEPGEHVVATCDYGGPVVAAVERGPLWATQFHPEKSGATGLAMLANFVASLTR
jgi:glutamine amidotransferase